MGFDIEIVKRGGEYWSCRDLQWGMILSHGELQICCTLNDNVTNKDSPFFGKTTYLHEGGLSPASFSKELFESVYQKKLEYIRQINSNESCICTNCPSLLYRNWEPMSKLVLNRFAFGNDFSCNSNCVYCPQNHTLKPDYHISDFINAGINLGYIDLDNIYYVSWAGGEPTISNDYEDMFQKLAKAKIRNQTITSAIKFSEQLAKLLEESDNDVVKLITSIDSGTRETYKKIKRVDQFNRVVENIDKYYKRAKRKSNIIVKYIVLEENYSYEEINSFLDLIKNNGWYGLTVAVSYNFLDTNRPKHIMQAIGYLAMKASMITGVPAMHGVDIYNFEKNFETSKLAKFGQIEHFAQENWISLDEVIEFVKNNKK